MPYNNRILIIDDDQAILDIFSSVLSSELHNEQNKSANKLSELLGISEHTKNRKREFIVDSARQGEAGYLKVKEALDRNEPYSVIFTDMRMPPGWDGARTAKEIRIIDPAVEIIVVTAFSDASISEIVKQVGFTDRLLYLKKPFDDEEILQLSDSLSMRWNLEEKVRGMVRILEDMIDSFFNLKLATYHEQELYPFLRKTLEHVASFLETPDVFLARVETGKITLQIGLGRFASGLAEDSEFIKLIHEAAGGKAINQVLRIDKYVVMPISCQSWQSIVVGLLSEFEIEGANQLLEVLAKNMSKVFETVSNISDLRSEIQSKDDQIQALRSQLNDIKPDNR
ncbi:MAG: response regulator [Methylococcales bacterium]|jgi:CheY-like chemotaxis protein|nr:response regulator [Methylococcales bacterium]MBT7445520.1 response regulator [Methylococcales bacterium]